MITTLILLASIVLLDMAITAVDILVLTILFVLLSYRYTRKTKYDWLYYVGATLMAILSIFLTIPYVQEGIIGYGLLNVVMFTGVLPDQWKLTVKLRAYRAFYSILGFILIVPHAFLNLFVDKQIDIFGIAAMIIMIPLFITSFNVVKKEVQSAEWVKLQKVSYSVYMAIFIHLLVVADWPGKVLYGILMTLYINNKLVKEYRQ